ncbi:MAG TPA: type II toxin-antitoxin system VapC family toxin [Terricaulis sp.]|nr:type II toxin-antitoxin system VapC family toxin [Terricaulis sp.]
MRAIDTNILVRLVACDDEKQTEAALALVHGGAWVSHLVLAEAIWVLGSAYRLPRGELINTLDNLLKHETLEIQEREVVAAALEVFRAGKKVEFTDCLVLEIGRKAGRRPLMTFDRDLAKLDGVERV